MLIKFIRLWILAEKIKRSKSWKFNWDLILQPKTLIKLETIEQVKSLYKEADKRGLKWHNGKRYIKIPMIVNTKTYINFRLGIFEININESEYQILNYCDITK